MKMQSRLGIVTFPISEAGVLPLSNLVDILLALRSDVCLITGGAGYKAFSRSPRVHIYQIRHRVAKSVPIRAMNYLWVQVTVSIGIVKLRKKVDQWFFFIGGEGLVLPILVAKLMGKAVIITSAGSGVKVSSVRKDPLTKVQGFLQSISYRLADRIILYSERLITEFGMSRHKAKISVAQRHFLDFSRFRIIRELDTRGEVVGYIGALSQTKGILNLLKAIRQVLIEKENINFFIAGSGDEGEYVKAYLKMYYPKDRVKLQGWIPHDEVPNYLNGMKLMVLPSFTEGLPNIILEAMACGTPVLTTAVGAIPDIIKDEETGFFINDNSPEGIARGIIRALDYPRLAEVADNARAFVEKEYNFQAAVTRYCGIIE